MKQLKSFARDQRTSDSRIELYFWQIVEKNLLDLEPALSLIKKHRELVYKKIASDIFWQHQIKSHF